MSTSTVGPITIVNNLVETTVGTLTVPLATITEMHLRYYTYQSPVSPNTEGSYFYWDQELTAEVRNPVEDPNGGYTWTPGTAAFMSAEKWDGMPVSYPTDSWILTFNISSTAENGGQRVHDLLVPDPFSLSLSYDFVVENNEVFYHMLINAAGSVFKDCAVTTTPVLEG